MTFPCGILCLFEMDQKLIQNYLRCSAACTAGYPKHDNSIACFSADFSFSLKSEFSLWFCLFQDSTYKLIFNLACIFPFGQAVRIFRQILTMA